MNLNEYYIVTERRPTGYFNLKGVQIIDWKFHFLFETKEEYLAFVAEWKVQYKELSARCKKAKQDVKDEMRADPNRAWKAQGHLMSLKGQAWMMLELRRQGKVAAAEQAQKQREAAVA